MNMVKESPTDAQSSDSCAQKKRGRPQNRWRIRVVRIDARKYAELKDREHPFASLAAEARTREIDAFCAKLWVRSGAGATVLVDSGSLLQGN
jgi:hypothetical protein